MDTYNVWFCAILTFTLFSMMRGSPCPGDHCQNGGLCVQNGSDISCLCKPGFQGKICSEELKANQSGALGTKPLPYKTIWVETEGIAWDMVVAYVVGFAPMAFIVGVLIFATWKVRKDEKAFREWSVKEPPISTLILPEQQSIQEAKRSSFSKFKRGRVSPMSSEQQLLKHKYRPISRASTLDETGSISESPRSSVTGEPLNTSGRQLFLLPKRGKVSPMPSEREQNAFIERPISVMQEEVTGQQERPQSSAQIDNRASICGPDDTDIGSKHSIRLHSRQSQVRPGSFECVRNSQYEINLTNEKSNNGETEPKYSVMDVKSTSSEILVEHTISHLLQPTTSKSHSDFQSVTSDFPSLDAETQSVCLEEQGDVKTSNLGPRMDSDDDSICSELRSIHDSDNLSDYSLIEPTGERSTSDLRRRDTASEDEDDYRGDEGKYNAWGPQSVSAPGETNLRDKNLSFK